MNFLKLYYNGFINKQLRNLNIIYITRLYSIRRLEDPYKVLPEHVKSKILYSSVLELKSTMLGYKKTKILHNKQQKEKEREKIKNIPVRSFPVILENPELSTERDTDESKESVCFTPKETQCTIPNHWMDDYEFFEGQLQSSDSDILYGTEDSTVAPSKVPCSGCGARLHCVHHELPGYIPKEIFGKRRDDELKQIVCQRCHFLKNYNIPLNVKVTPDMYVETLSTIKDKFALAIVIVDLLDFPCSIWPDIREILGNKRPIFIVGNKVDLLPKDSKNYLNHIKYCLKEEFIKCGFQAMNIINVSLISAKTGYGIEELITQLQKNWAHKGDVYLIGCTNVGKSSLFNILSTSDYCKADAIDLVKKATACPWPGTTLQMLKFPIQRPSDFKVFHRCRRLISERAERQAELKLHRIQAKEDGSIQAATPVGHIGRTVIHRKECGDAFSMTKSLQTFTVLDESKKEFRNCYWCFDTPGVMQFDQIYNLLTADELAEMAPTKMISPRCFCIKPGMTLFLAGIARLDFVEGDFDSLKLPVYSSHALPVVISLTKDADDVYDYLLGNDIFGIPTGDMERLKKWPGLTQSKEIAITGQSDSAATCDILLSSSGWAAIKIPQDHQAMFRVWTPERRGVFVRNPSLIPFGEKLCGKRIRGSLAYRIGKPFIRD